MPVKIENSANILLIISAELRTREKIRRAVLRTPVKNWAFFRVPKISSQRKRNGAFISTLGRSTFAPIRSAILCYELHNLTLSEFLVCYFFFRARPLASNFVRLLPHDLLASFNGQSFFIFLRSTFSHLFSDCHIRGPLVLLSHRNNARWNAVLWDVCWYSF